MKHIGREEGDYPDSPDKVRIAVIEFVTGEVLTGRYGGTHNAGEIVTIFTNNPRPMFRGILCNRKFIKSMYVFNSIPEEGFN